MNKGINEWNNKWTRGSMNGIINEQGDKWIRENMNRRVVHKSKENWKTN